jgi:UDP-4-amino-4,6-dideoxy-N-acetyl-beta-L-altrosamine transaminase
MIPYGKQNISEDDIQSVVDVLRSDFLTQGPIVPKFEAAVAQYCCVKHGVAVNSATSALHIACLTLGVGKGDLVWTSAITFVASANCAIYCGAKVDFVDIDPKNYNLSLDSLTQKLEDAEKKGRLPKVVIPVHLAGQSCNMFEIHELSKKYGFKIIEDASHAIGGKYQNDPIGSCKYSDITVFSFHPVKIITTGEGGMAMTNNDSYCGRMQQLRSHGITRDPNAMTHTPDGPWYYQQVELGFNYRMTDILGALGLSQVDHLDDFVAQRHDIARQYNDFFDKCPPIINPSQGEDSYSSFHLYIIRVLKSKSTNHQTVFEKLRSNGVMVNLHYIPIYHHPFFSKMGFQAQDFPVAENYYTEAISLPIYPGLKEKQIRTVVNSIIKPISHQTFF